MAIADPLLRATLAGSEALARATKLSVNVSARVGNELVGISRHGEVRRRTAGLPVGHRAPLAPPIGATLLAWSDDAEIDHWLNRGGLDAASEPSIALRALLAGIRERGYLATVRTASYAALSFAVAQRREEGAEPRSRGITARELFGSLCQPDSDDRQGEFDISYIGAPIFDAAGRPLYSVTLSGFAGRIGWREIEDNADELTQMCAEVVRQHRIGS
jgi:DNA-binding IclR family transcriptional regulator